jgi:hypothetical protein
MKKLIMLLSHSNCRWVGIEYKKEDTTYKNIKHVSGHRKIITNGGKWGNQKWKHQEFHKESWVRSW